MDKEGPPTIEEGAALGRHNKTDSRDDSKGLAQEEGAGLAEAKAGARLAEAKAGAEAKAEAGLAEAKAGARPDRGPDPS